VSNRKLIFVLAAVAFIDMTAIMALSPFFPEIAADLNTSVALLGQTQMAMYLVAAGLGLFIGPLSDHYGLRRTMVASALLLATGTIVTGLATDYWLLLLGRIPTGLGVMGAISMAVVASRLPQEERRDGLGWVVGAMPLAAIVGVPMLAFIAYHSSWRVSFFALGSVGVLLAVLIWRMVPEDPPLPASTLQMRAILKSYTPVVADRSLLLLFLADFLRGITWSGMMTYIAAYFIQEYGVSLQQYGVILFGGGLAYLSGTRFGTGRFPYMGMSSLAMISTLMVALSVTFLLASIWPLFVIVILLLITGFVGGLAFTVQTILISEQSSAGRGLTMMLRKVGVSLSGAIGAGSGGALLSLGGYPVLGIGLSGFAVFAAVVVFLVTRVPSPVPVEPSVSAD
jgi:MFS transporter, DHA1 family, inner membrane transport protein